MIDAINARRGLKWGGSVMLLTMSSALAAVHFRAQVDTGGPGWLNLLVILCLWNALKLLLIGPISLLKLMTVRVREELTRRRMMRALLYDGVEPFGERMLAG